MLPFTGSSQLQQQQTSNYPRPPRATDDPSRHSTVSAAPVGGRPDLATVETTARGPLHPLRGAAPDQKRCTAYGSGAAHPITRTNAESARRGSGCGTRGQRQGLAGLRGYAPSGARGADGSRAGRRPRAHKAARPGTTARGPLHPLRAAAPVTGRCTRSEGVHCLRIGCSTPNHKNKRGICETRAWLRCPWAAAGPGRTTSRRAERSSRRGRLAGGPTPTGASSSTALSRSSAAAQHTAISRHSTSHRRGHPRR